jgi:hypothetical protein
LRLGNCSKTCSSNSPPRGPAARRGDGVTRDETAWTWWTLPPAISGCLARRYRKCIPVSSHSCWTTPNMPNPGLAQGRQQLVVASGCQEREIRPCSSPMTASRDAVVPMRLRIPPTRVARAVGLSWQPARVTAQLRICTRCRAGPSRRCSSRWRRRAPLRPGAGCGPPCQRPPGAAGGRRHSAPPTSAAPWRGSMQATTRVRRTGPARTFRLGHPPRLMARPRPLPSAPAARPAARPRKWPAR